MMDTGEGGGVRSEVRPMTVQTPRSSGVVRKLEPLSPIDMYSSRHKRTRVNEGKEASNIFSESKYKRRESPDIVDYSDPFAVPNLMEELARGMYGSATKDILELKERRMRLLSPFSALYPSHPSRHLDSSPQTPKCGSDTSNRLNMVKTEESKLAERRADVLEEKKIIHIDDDFTVVDIPSLKDSRFTSRSARETEESFGCIIRHATANHDAAGHGENAQNSIENVVILDSDEEEAAEAGKSIVTYTSTLYREVRGVQHENIRQEVIATKTVVRAAPEVNRQASFQYQEVVLKKPIDATSGLVSEPIVQIKDFSEKNVRETKVVKEEQGSLIAKTEEVKRDKGVYLGVQDDLGKKKSNQRNGDEDSLADMWREMTLALEFSKDAAEEGSATDDNEEEDETCDHSFFLKDDLGYVCRVCGLIQKSIETIFDYQWGKTSKTTRTYMYDSRSTKDREQNDATSLSGLDISEQNLAVAEISVHPRHMKQMKPHQIEGFNFLARNLVADEPGGCILAHAPGSGKTFMIISFVQSFLARYPNARPLVVLPKGILGTWKKEFQKWQIEDLPLYDLYSSKAEKRSEQLDILKEWVDNKGVMFLGYKQFSNIVCGSASDKVAAACHDILLKVPTILILDEGHTPRNENTDVLNSLAKVQTPRKVVLSGTLFQNHVKEVFNILNLVRPKFLRLDSSKTIKRRIMSRVQIGGRRQMKAGGGDPLFYELIEETLQRDENFGRKVTVIHDLREMTSKVLHYYKGDFLDELPGLVDLTVLLNLSPKQKHQLEKLKKMEKFKRSSIGSAVYLHPQLKEFSETALLGEKGCNFDEAKMDNLLDTLDVKDGVKAKFFLNILRLCESSGEKLLVFSQYLLPLKFLEKLTVKTKGWRSGKEIFMISGDSSADHREWSMERFNNSSEAKVFFGSIKACGEGISLVGASRVLILDVHLNPSVTRQAIGRAFRPGQVRKVHIYRLVAAESPEEENHQTCFRKELISKMWFEWSECCGQKDFEMDTVGAKEIDDMFFESPLLVEDVKLLYRRLVNVIFIHSITPSGLTSKGFFFCPGEPTNGEASSDCAEWRL